MAVRVGARWRGVLLRGASGIGKSDLALRAMAAGARLVADDRVVAWTSAGGLWGRAPDSLAGLIEVRGVGIVSVPPRPLARVDLVADLLAPGASPERLPEPARTNVLGVAVPHLQLRGAEAGAWLRLLAALGAGAGGVEPRHL